MTKLNDNISNEAMAAFAQPLVSGWAVKEGDFAMVFDCDKWHVDRGDNSEFWKKAKVLKVYWYNAKIGSSDWVVDVQFEDGRISKAHFLKLSLATNVKALPKLGILEYKCSTFAQC